MKVLAVCQMGVIRSATVAFIAKGRGHDALAAGVDPRANTPETRAMLCAWADRVLVAEGWIAAELPEEHRGKVIDLALGPDVWRALPHPDLIFLVEARLEETGALA